MSYVDEPSRVRAPQLIAAAITSAGLFALASQITVMNGSLSSEAKQVLVAFDTSPRTSGAEPVKKQSEKMETESEHVAQDAPSTSAGRPTPASRQAAPVGPMPALAELPRISDQQASPLITPQREVQSRPDLPLTRDPLAAYLARLRARILAQQPAKTGNSGRVTIEFEVAPTGKLTRSTVAVSSGDVRLDRAALNMVRRAAPFPSPEQPIAPERMHFEIEVRFF